MLVAAVGVAWLTGTPKVVVVMVGFSIFIASFAIGVGGTGWLIQGEVFPTAVRGRAAATGAGVNWIANFALIEAFPIMQSAFGLPTVMVILSALSLLAIVFISKFLPETKSPFGRGGRRRLRPAGGGRTGHAISAGARLSGERPARRFARPGIRVRTRRCRRRCQSTRECDAASWWGRWRPWSRL